MQLWLLVTSTLHSRSNEIFCDRNAFELLELSLALAAALIKKFLEIIRQNEPALTTQRNAHRKLLELERSRRSIYIAIVAAA